MTARIKIDQAGLSAGVAGVSRTDGLDTGAPVTLEDVEGTGASSFHLLWGPPEDTTAEASLAATGDPNVWEFTPTAAAYGSYVIELRENGVRVERRIFGIRTPANGLLIPALNERASRHAGWEKDGATEVDLSENNASDFPLSVLNNFRYAGWWRSLYELYRIVEFGTGSIADNALALAKLVTAASAPSFVAATTNGNFTEVTQATVAASLRGLGLTLTGNSLAVRQRARSVQLRDYFLSGSNSTGQIGALGWHLLGTGTPAYSRTNASFAVAVAQRGQLSTSAATNNRSVLALGETETRQIMRPSDLNFMQVCWALNNQLQDRRVFFGLSDNLGTEPASMANGIGIYYDSVVSANYQIISRSGSAGSPTVTALAVPANSSELLTIWQPTPGTFEFYSGATLLGTINSGVAATGMGLGIRSETLANATKALNIGYFGLDAVGSGALDDDTFLDA